MVEFFDDPSAEEVLDATQTRVSQKERGTDSYYPLVDTLRLYCGWLLAWYFLIFAVGFYVETKHLPFTVPFLESLFFSSTVLSFACAAFLFLLFTSIHRLLGRGWLKGILLTLVGVAVFIVVRANM